MKYFALFLFAAILSCTSKPTTEAEDVHEDSITVDKTKVDVNPDTVYNDPESISPTMFGNARFRNVTVEKTGDNTYLLKGQGQIFEANFNWVIEDGHDELQKGYTMTDAGAPEWGNFSFSVTQAKKDPNSTLHIILFESSAKDGSRQYELPIPLN